MTRVLTLGETMALLDPVGDGEIAAGTTLTLRIAGAESNFGIALSRLGVDVTWISRLGQDRFGDVISDTLGGEGLRLDYVQRDPEAPTGVFFKWRSDGRSSVLYYRKGSAASRLHPEDVPDAAFDEIRLLHLTGITMALSESARETVFDAAGRAKARGIPLLFDPNFRPALWESPAQALASHRELLPLVDWYLCGLEEGSLLFGTQSPDELFATLAAGGARGAVVRIGAHGALVSTEAGPVEVAPLRIESVLDEIGAGDGFAAGFAYGLLQGWAAPTCTQLGNLIAASALRGTGDWETFPQRAELEAELQALAAD